MDSAQYPFGKIHYLFRKADHIKWQRQESKRHILRSQLGFTDVASTRPKPCAGCANYHGMAYGYSRETRSPLICGFHPYGWQDKVPVLIGVEHASTRHLYQEKTPTPDTLF